MKLGFIGAVTFTPMSNRLQEKLEKIKRVLLGGSKNLRDPHLFHHLSLATFFAWVGLGADGLSSSCYGPEEAFLALHHHASLGIFVAAATALTIFIIAASYTQIVELFPSGGGGYLVASKLLSPSVGMVSGCALVIDYILTITLSVAAGADAIFSFFPAGWLILKLPFAAGGILLLIVLNLRGVKESILLLVPVFLIFLLTHTAAILFGFCLHACDVNTFLSVTAADVKASRVELGTVGMILLVLRAYSMGAGTYTGIEAVSNGVPILREPKVMTAKTTMYCMASSLAFMAFGLMLGYLLYHVHHVPGKTLNAVFLETVTAGWNRNTGQAFVFVALVSEAVLLFVAAQTGFLDGPRVLANMAADRWLPSQFALLSERFVIKHGILLMGLSSLLLMILSRGAVKLLVILYSVNVFITFCLSQAGMVRHWWRQRAQVVGWWKKFFINGVGLLMTSFILISVVIVKFHEGGWITLIVTGSLIFVAAMIHRYYARTQELLKRLDKLVDAVVAFEKQHSAAAAPAPAFVRTGKTAVILVNGFNGMGLHTLFNVIRIFGDHFKNFLFLEAGIVDADRFKGPGALQTLEKKINADLDRYAFYMRRQGFFVKTFSAIGTDVVDEICLLAKDISCSHPHCIFFGGQIVFDDGAYLDRFLYNHVTFAVQRRLHQEGIPFFVVPVKVG